LLTRPSPLSNRLFEQTYWSLAISGAMASLWLGSPLPALAMIAIFGLPHGALDGEMAREILRHRFRSWWFPSFALPYLFLVGMVLWCWHVWPVGTLNAFLVLSLCHFGMEREAGNISPASVLAWGGAPLILPCLLRPDATAALLSTMVLPESLSSPPLWLVTLAPLWIASVALDLATCQKDTRRHHLCLMTGLVIIFWLCQPLQAFMLYFVFIHAPAHINTLIKDIRWSRIASWQTALLHALPLTLATGMIALALWPFFAGSHEMRSVQITFQLLAALTLPHMIFERLVTFFYRRLPVSSEGTILVTDC